MKQVIQSLATGDVEVADVPAPEVRSGHLLIKTSKTLISAGTERMLLKFGKASLLDKARQQPEQVKKVLGKIKTDGLVPTIEAVKSKLDSPIPLGYSNVGRVVGIGNNVVGYSLGDVVVSNGSHAEYVCVAKNLCAKVPEGVSEDHAVFTVLGAISLNGIRLLDPTIGENFVVMGLGIIGIMAAQLLEANGCRVLCLDISAEKIKFAKELGLQAIQSIDGSQTLANVDRFSSGVGTDGVIMTLASSSDDPIQQASLMCRKKGRIVLTGVTGLNINRSDFYEKELTFQVSCSYGPGRYDPNFEEKGQEYPIGHVRWNEQSNFETVLNLMKSKKINVGPMVSEKFSITDSYKAYEKLYENSEGCYGLLLDYGDRQEDEKATPKPAVVGLPIDSSSVNHPEDGSVNVAIIGTGGYATRYLLPSLNNSSANIVTAVSKNGITAYTAAKKFKIPNISSNWHEVIDSNDVNCIVIATRHDLHAEIAIAALNAGKHVYCEKPLAINQNELDRVIHAYNAAKTRYSNIKLMVGFNRRFSSHSIKLKSILDNFSAPKAIIYTVNAGSLPFDHWTQDRSIGGGRVVGEGCHFIDLIRFLTSSPIIDSHIDALFEGTKNVTNDCVTINLKLLDGSIGTVHYFTNGSQLYPKENIQVFCGSQTFVLDNFRSLTGFGSSNFKKLKTFRQDKANFACIDKFISSINESSSLIPVDEIFEVNRLCIELTDNM